MGGGRMPDWIANNLEGIFSAAALGVIGAVLAGFSAWLKTWFVDRDDKTRAAAQLELASKRTEFALQWLAAKRIIAEDETTPADVKDLAQQELDAAFLDAQHGFADGGSAIEEARYEQVVDQLQGLLLLRSGLSTSSKWLVTFFYVCVFGLAAVLGVQENVACNFASAEASSVQPAEAATGGVAPETPSADQDAVSADAPAPAPLEVVVEGPVRVVSGKEATYTIRVTNTGTETLQDVMVSGAFGNPAHIEFRTAGTATGTEATRPTLGEETGVFEWPPTEVPVSGALAFPLTVVVVADQGTDLAYQADVEAIAGTTVTATATARTDVSAPCVQYRFIESGWAWFFGAVAGTVILRLLFGWLIARNEGRRGEKRALRWPMPIPANPRRRRAGREPRPTTPAGWWWGGLGSNPRPTDYE